jgi:hypothetical protein
MQDRDAKGKGEDSAKEAIPNLISACLRATGRGVICTYIFINILLL